MTDLKSEKSRDGKDVDPGVEPVWARLLPPEPGDEEEELVVQPIPPVQLAGISGAAWLSNDSFMITVCPRAVQTVDKRQTIMWSVAENNFIGKRRGCFNQSVRNWKRKLTCKTEHLSTK